MKVVFLAGSRKFSDEISRISRALENSGINVLKGRDYADENDKEKIFTDKMKQGIEDSDIIYVIAKDGYTGDSTKLEILYAHEKGKELIASETVKDDGIRKLVSKIMNADELVAYLKDSP